MAAPVAEPADPISEPATPSDLAAALAALIASHGGNVGARDLDHALGLLHDAAVDAPGALPAPQVRLLRMAKFVARHVDPGLWRDPASRAALKSQVRALLDRYLPDGADVHGRA